MMLSLNSFDKVRDFVNAISPFDTEVNLISGKYVVNAKSVMAIFSLDLSKPIEAVADEESATANKELGQIKIIMQRFQA